MEVIEPTVAAPTSEEQGENPSKKALKKAEKKAAKDAKRADGASAQQAEQQAAQEVLLTKVDDPMGEATFGYLPLCNSSYKTNRVWTKVNELVESKAGEEVWIRARLQESRCKGAIGFLVLREQFSTVQAVIDASAGKQMVKWAGGVPNESIVDVKAKVVLPKEEVQSTSQNKVELAIERIFCVNKAANELPFQLRDANRSEEDIQKLGEAGITVSQDTRLDNRIMDLRTYASQAIFRISSQTCTLFREALLKMKFMEIHSPKLQGGSSEGGSNVFTLKYFGRDACLAQSPQLYKQMAMMGDFDRVFEIGPVFRAENSNTHRHLCEFTGLDMEMTIKENYEEVLDVLDGMFRYIFAGLEERCAEEINVVFKQFPNRPFCYGKEKTLRLKFAEGIQMLRDADVADIPDDISSFDLSTEQEKALGKLVHQKYLTDFYFLTDFPLGVRPFYTMPSPNDPKISNSYDFFMRGEEIVSGAQRIHDPQILTERAIACGINPATIKDYIDSFTLGSFPHGGCGVGLERVVMLFLGLPNIRKTCLFPRDPKRLSP